MELLNAQSEKNSSDKEEDCVNCDYNTSKLADHQDLIRVLSNQINNQDMKPIKTTENFNLFCVGDDYLGIECTNCEKVYKYDRLKYFEDVSSKKCINTTDIVCPNCGNSAKAYSKILAKKSAEYKEGLRCPRCDSTLITVSQSNPTLFEFIFGCRTRPISICKNCGYSWKLI